MNPKLVVEQKITAFVNKYAVYQADAQGQKTELMAFAQQKRFAFKEKVTFYGDEAKTKEIFGFRAEKVMDIHGRYFVSDANGQTIGAFRKKFGQSLLVSSWTMLDANDKIIFTVKESSVLLAILRRFISLVPFVGDYLSLLIILFKYHFVIIDEATGEAVGKYQKTTLLRDHYLLSITNEAYAKADWRTFAAMAVGLDALQSR